MAISSSLSGDLAEQFDMQEEARTRGHAAAIKRAEGARAQRQAAWDQREAERAADRARAAMLSPEEEHKVSYFLRWLRHVDQLRHSDPPGGIAAYHRMHSEIDRLDPPNADGEQRLWAFAAHEANERHRFGRPQDRVLTPGFWAWSLDVRRGRWGSKPAPATPAEPTASGERVDAAAASAMRADGDCIRIEASR